MNGDFQLDLMPSRAVPLRHLMMAAALQLAHVNVHLAFEYRPGDDLVATLTLGPDFVKECRVMLSGRQLARYRDVVGILEAELTGGVRKLLRSA